MRVSLPLLNYLPGVYQGGAGGPQARRVTFGLNLAWSPLTIPPSPLLCPGNGLEKVGSKRTHAEPLTTLEIGQREVFWSEEG